MKFQQIIAYDVIISIPLKKKFMEMMIFIQLLYVCKFIALRIKLP